MAISNYGTPIGLGGARYRGSSYAPALNSVSAVAAALACITHYGQLWWADGGTHTVNTTGSSSIQWSTGTVTFSNAGSTFKIGIAPMDTTNGPPGRAAHSSGTIAFDVAAVYTGSGGTPITTNSWITSVPTTGSKTIASGDFVAISMQMTTRAGSDTIQLRAITTSSAQFQNLPACSTSTNGTTFTGQNNAGNPHIVTASDGTVGWFLGAETANSAGTLAIGSGQTNQEAGNIFNFTSPTRIIGMDGWLAAAAGSTIVFTLYRDPFGTATSIGSISVPLGVHHSSTNGYVGVLFSSPINLDANTEYAGVLTNNTANTTTINNKTYGASSNQIINQYFGSRCYGVKRPIANAAFTAESTVTYVVGLVLLGASNPVSAGYGMGI